MRLEIEEEHAFVGHLAYTVKPLLRLYADHLAEWCGEFFPYLWMAEIVKAMDGGGFSERDMVEILTALDRYLGLGSDRVQNLIAVGFVESLPTPSIGRGNIVDPYPNLKEQYQVVFGRDKL